MKLEEFKERLEVECQKLNLPKLQTAKQGFSFIKVEVKISAETSIEIYFNEETQSLTPALLIQDKRVFGIDGYPKGGIWHVHPFGRVEETFENKSDASGGNLERICKALATTMSNQIALTYMAMTPCWITLNRNSASNLTTLVS